MCFFCPYSILVTLLREEGACLCAYSHLFVSYAHVNLCHLFSSTWCQGLAVASTCGSSWTFLFTFLSEKLPLSTALLNLATLNCDCFLPLLPEIPTLLYKICIFHILNDNSASHCPSTSENSILSDSHRFYVRSSIGIKFGSMRPPRGLI